MASSSDRHISVLSFADELTNCPDLLTNWSAAFRDGGEITLIIHPGPYQPDEVAPRIHPVATAAGLDDDSRANVVLLTGPLTPDEELSLSRRCAAVLSRRLPSAPYHRLRSGHDALLSELSDVMRARERELSRLHSRQVAVVGGTHRVVHRGNPEDLGVLADIFGEEAYSLRRFAFYPGMARPHDASTLGGRPLIVDCGGNIGAASIYFSLSFPDARVVSVEPEAENFDLLCQNVATFPNVRPLRKAISSASGKMLLGDPGLGAWGYRTGTADFVGEVIGTVDAVSVGDIVDQEPGTVPFVLKVDIEGAEADLFSAETEAISQFPIVIVELHDRLMPGRGISQSFLEWHVSQRREFIHYGENIFSLCREFATG